MVEDLYQRDLLRLAADASGAGRLEQPDGSATVDNPLCGDRVTIDIQLGLGGIAELRHDTRACVLCQASAAILAAEAEGEDAASLKRLEAAVGAMLREAGSAPEGKWQAYAAFGPVAPYRNRHSCVLLPIEAAWKACEAAAD